MWKVFETAEATFEVDDYENYVRVQSEAAIRNAATSYPYDAHDDAVVSLRGATSAVADHMKQEVQQRLQKAGVEVRVIGKVDRRLDGVETRKLAPLRLHVRAIVRDGTAAFVGSQSLRKLELDGRREVGVIITDTPTAQKIRSVFEDDWRESGGERAEKPAKAEEISAVR